MELIPQERLNTNWRESGLVATLPPLHPDDEPNLALKFEMGFCAAFLLFSLAVFATFTIMQPSLLLWMLCGAAFTTLLSVIVAVSFVRTSIEEHRVFELDAAPLSLTINTLFLEHPLHTETVDWLDVQKLVSERHPSTGSILFIYTSERTLFLRTSASVDDLNWWIKEVTPLLKKRQMVLSSEAISDLTTLGKMVSQQTSKREPNK